MKTRKLGTTGVTVSAIGLGGMYLSLKGRPEEPQGIAVIHRALDLGITFIDTADSYCIDEKDKHHNECLIAKALASYPSEVSQVIVATKGGLLRPNGDWVAHGDPKHLSKTIRESFAALGGEKPIPLWQLHAVDPKFPIEESLKAVRDAVDEGLIRFVGLSNVSVTEIEKARNVVQIVSIQNRYNPWDRSPEKDGVLDYCEKEGLTFLPWSPLGGGSRVKTLPDLKPLKELSAKKNISPYRLTLAWMRQRSIAILPIPGASRLETLNDSAQAVEVELTSEEIQFLNENL